MSLLVDAWCRWMIEGSLGCLAVFLVVALLWRGVRRWSSAHTGSWLLLLPLLVLVLPIGRSLPKGALGDLPGLGRAAGSMQSLLGLLPGPVPGAGGHARTARPAASGRSDALPSALDGPASAEPAGPVAPAAVDGARPTSERWPVRDLLFVLWAAVVGALLLTFVRNQCRVRALIRRARPVSPERLGLRMERLTRRAGVRAKVRLAITEELASPATWGVGRPVILLPANLLGAKPAALSWLVLHELAHQRRKDLVVTAAQQLLQVLFFFHPCVWITNRLVGGLRERACDDAALANRDGRDRLACAAVFLEVLEGASCRRPAPQGLPLLLDHRVELRRRMMNLLDSRHRAPRGVTRGSLAVLLAGTLLAAPAAAWLTAPLHAGAAATASAQTQEGLARALDWLKSQQHEDGHWTAGPEVEDSGEFNQVGITALATLAFLEGSAPDAAHRKETAARGLQWLHSVQGESGRFGLEEGWQVQASHAVATIAWMQGRGLVAPETWQPAAQKAVDHILKSQNPYRGWRFGATPDGDNDSFVTGLMLWALQDARRAGLEVSPTSFEWGYSFLDSMLDPATGRTGYNGRGSPPARLMDKVDSFPPEKSEYPTALALFVRSRDARATEDAAVRTKAVDLLQLRPPLWSPADGSIDFYYWWFGANALGRVDLAAATPWHGALEKALLGQQSADGSWPAADAWSAEQATVHATALCALALAAAS